MDDNFLEFIQYIEDDLLYLRVPRRILRDKQNPLNKYTNSELLNRYRFSRNTIGNLILPMVYPPNMPDTQRGLPVPPLIKLCTALRFYATGSFQRTCGDLQSISQSSVCRIVGEVSEILARNLGRYVKFPNTAEEIALNRNLFYNIAMFPGVIGCIDGTHIEIKSPGGPTAENYRNRKGWMSLNVQAVAGPHLEILEIVIRWPGSTHDSRIFNSSALKMKFEDARLSGILLGDSAYQQTHYLYTPMQNPNTQAERRYNYAQIRTRNVVERAFGVWKGRFRCLNSAINCSLRKTLRIITTTAVLHNIAVGEKEPFLHDPNFIEHVVPNPPPLPQLARGNAVRATFIGRHFANPINQN